MATIYTDGELVYGAFEAPPAVVGLPDGCTFARLKIRCDRIATIYLKIGNRFEERYAEYADAERKTVRPGLIRAQNIR
jgi:hypothetical protein